MNSPYRKPKKIIARVFGGLGNQLFCYAAARRLALVNSAELVIDNISGFAFDVAYHRQYQLDHFNISSRKASTAERLEPFSRARRFLKRQLNQCFPFELRAYIQQNGNNFDPRLLNVKPHGEVYLEGYWQSEGYFKDVEASIRDDLQIISPTNIDNMDTAERMRNHLSIAVHVRFFDNPHEASIHNASDDYYARAVSTMEMIIPNAHYFIFSDRPDDARVRIPLPDDRVTCLSHNQGDENAYADLWLMTQCQHFIIANSTFSWWGAWLAKHAGKQVIAPGEQPALEGVGGWGFDGLLPKEWIVL